MDSLSDFFNRIELQGSLFFAGNVKGTLKLEKPVGTAFIHIMEKGGFQMVRRGTTVVNIDEPSVLLCPSNCQYQLRATNPVAGANIVCAAFPFGDHMASEHHLGMTATMIFSFNELDHAPSLIATMMREFDGNAPGRSKALSVLFEYLLVLLLRHALTRNMINAGVLYGLLDAKLAPVLTAIHATPDRDWKLAELAKMVNMSRTAFTEYFARVLGQSAIGYVASWRIKRAQALLRRGVPIKAVAASVGYSSQSAFTRSFVQQVGSPPGAWLKT